jgi:hypothetical protein
MIEVDKQFSAEEVQKVGSFLLGHDKKFSEPQVKVLLELLRHDKPILKSDLFDSEIVPYIRAEGIASEKVLDLPMYREVIDIFCRSKMAHKRKRVNEIIAALNPNYKPKKVGFLSRLFGGGDD